VIKAVGRNADAFLSMHAMQRNTTATRILSVAFLSILFTHAPTYRSSTNQATSDIAAPKESHRQFAIALDMREGLKQKYFAGSDLRWIRHISFSKRGHPRPAIFSTKIELLKT
jgi:hypothetical protein